MSYFVLIGLFAVSSVAQVGCQGSSTGPGEVGFDYDALAQALSRTGLELEKKGEVEQEFFAVGGRVLTLDGEDVQVFEYENAQAAASDAAKVSPDGGSIGTAMVHWLGPPHFFRRDRIIALYVGEKTSVKEALESVLGPQFAGVADQPKQ